MKRSCNYSGNNRWFLFTATLAVMFLLYGCKLGSKSNCDCPKFGHINTEANDLAATGVQ